MHNVIIGNCGNENMVGEVWKMDQTTRDKRSIVAHRLLWLMDEGDLAVMPYKVAPDFLQYMSSFLDRPLSLAQILLPDDAESNTQLLTFDVLSSPTVVAGLQARTRDHAWRPLPYYFDRSVAWLAEKVGLESSARTLDFFRQGGAEMFNSKCEFRRIASAHGIPVAGGFVCSSGLELLHAVSDLLPQSGRVIIKQDLNAGGTGNVVLTTGEEVSSLGAAETVRLLSGDDLRETVNALWQHMTGPRNANLVAEVYYPDCRAYYTELDVFADGRRPQLLNFGEMRMEPVWVGFDIPSETLGAYQLGELTSRSAQLADVAREMGYSGKINCDAIVTPTGQVLFTEINGRLGGCTHIHDAAVKLLGADYGDRLTVLTRNKVKAPAFPQAVKALDRAGILLQRGDQRGVVILTEDTRRSGTLEYMVVAEQRAEALALEAQALQILAQAALPIGSA